MKHKSFTTFYKFSVTVKYMANKRMTMSEISSYKKRKYKDRLATASALKKGVIKFKQKPYNIDEYILLLKSNDIKIDFGLHNLSDRPKNE